MTPAPTVVCCAAPGCGEVGPVEAMHSDDEDNYWCAGCCPVCRERGESVKQTIEVEVGPEDDAGTCLVVLGDRRHERWDVNTVRAFGLTVPEAEPERVGYPLQHVTESPFNGRISIHDHEEVLKPAHSLRVGDRLEWAPGDWREITEVERTPDNYVAIRVGTGTWYLKPFSLLAVRPA